MSGEEYDTEFCIWCIDTGIHQEYITCVSRVTSDTNEGDEMNAKGNKIETTDLRADLGVTAEEVRAWLALNAAQTDE